MLWLLPKWTWLTQALYIPCAKSCVSFHCLSRTKGSVLVRGTGIAFVAGQFLQRGVVSISPKPQVRGPPLICCPPLLIQYIRSYPPYLRPFLHPQHEDALCHGDRDPITMANIKLRKFLLTLGDRMNFVPLTEPNTTESLGWVKVSQQIDVK
jgi:hypothetical protein